MKPLSLLLAVGAGLLAPGWATRAAAPVQPNFVVVLSDDHTYRAVGYRNAQVKTPNMDRLAAEGLRLDRLFVASPICVASRASLLTGVFPQQHGAVGLFSDGFRQSVLVAKRFATLPEVLGKAGYHTALYGKSHLGDPLQFGFAEGRETRAPNDEDLFAEAEAFLRREAKSGRPFLLWLTPHNPHLPLTAPQRFQALYKDATITLDANFREAPLQQSVFNQGGAGEIRFRDSNAAALSGGPPRPAAQLQEFIKAYYADISCLDEQLGRLVEQLKAHGLHENSILIYLSDNGYHLGNHGLGNKITMHEESVRVPAFLYSPLLPQKRARSDALVSSLDIYPTLLDLAGASAFPPQLMGKSLRPILGDASATVRDHVVSECIGPPEQRLGTGHRMVRTDRYKYMLSSSDEEAFFDLHSDPYELTNRVGDPALRAALDRHRRLLRDWMSAVGEKRVPVAPSTKTEGAAPDAETPAVEPMERREGEQKRDRPKK